MAGRRPGRGLVAAARARTSRSAPPGYRTIRAMRPLPGNGAPMRRGGCSSSCRTRRSDRSRWCLRSLSRRSFRRPRLRLQDYLGALILFAGIAGEALADAQLKRFRERSRQPGPGLRCRAVALVAPSELFLRMARLACLSRHRDFARLPSHYPWGWARLLAPAFMYWILVLRHGHPAAGSADAAFARRALSRVPVAHQHVLSAAAAE